MTSMTCSDRGVVGPGVAILCARGRGDGAAHRGRGLCRGCARAVRSVLAQGALQPDTHSLRGARGWVPARGWLAGLRGLWAGLRRRAHRLPECRSNQPDLPPAACRTLDLAA